jgi:hypothetical protein
VDEYPAGGLLQIDELSRVKKNLPQGDTRYEQRYQFGHEKDFVPPLTGIHLAALTPAWHQVQVYLQQVDKIDLDTNADLIAISFFSGFAMEAFRLANEFRKRNKTVMGVARMFHSAAKSHFSMFSGE